MAPPTIGTLPDGTRGVDCNARVSADAARAFVERGFRFVVRYVRRVAKHDYDVTAGEIVTLLEAGLGVMLVQHVAPEGWTPDPALGTTYGRTAASEAKRVGLPAGVTVWCDLEGVGAHVPHSDVIGYCNRWYDAVRLAGYKPGLYVGFGAGLTAGELYAKLKFQAYWSAYNLNADQVPAVRGVQMRQRVAPADDLVGGFTNQNMDVNVIRRDALDGTPTLLLPALP